MVMASIEAPPVDSATAATAIAGNEATLPLSPIPAVDIDEGGTFKYILVKLHDAPPNVKGVKGGMFLVRGHQWADYHADLYEEVESYIARNNITYRSEVAGGGRIAFNRDRKHIEVYGYSVGFGRANHSISCQLIKQQFPDFTVEWNNNGY